MPKASVIIPVYNGGDYIGETIDSILSQSFHDFELIIVDDGSTDDTADVIHGFRDSRIRYFHQPNSGKPASPRNNAIRKSEGDIIFIFDSDDIMLPGKLATTVQCMELAPELASHSLVLPVLMRLATSLIPVFWKKTVPCSNSLKDQ